MLGEHLKRIYRSTPKQVRQLIIGVVGFTILLLGAALLILPGPGIVVIVVGLVVLAVEFVWAKSLLAKVKARMPSKEQVRTWSPLKKTLLGISAAIGVLFTVASAVYLFAPINLTGIEKSDGRVYLENITLPQGFSIEVYASNITNARSLAYSKQFNIVFVSTKDAGNIYALRDVDNDYKPDKQFLIASNLDTPNGIALYKGDLYVAEKTRIVAIREIERHTGLPPLPRVVYDGLPEEDHHGWRYMRVGPDNKLYVAIGAPCNVCDEGDPYATIARLNPNGSGFEIYARGIRNSVGFDWHPTTKELWFTENGRDLMGDNKPGDELNVAPVAGMHFGYPYCHAKNITDDKFDARSCSEFTPAAKELGPHVAALGMRFYNATQFPEYYRQGIFIAEHGSWNRREPIGYRITFVKLENNEPVSYETFAEGWLVGEESWGRPVDIEILNDGSLVVSDDKAGKLYRITYDSSIAKQ
jgi:glucose/arabinose dehydrogenase